MSSKPPNTPAAKHRPVGHRWQPGQSGNPGGRPKTKELEQYARTKGPAAIDRLMEIGKGRGVASVKALELVLAYGYGRPAHAIAITAPGGQLNGAFAGAARAMLEAAIERAEGGKPDYESGSPPSVIDVTVNESVTLPTAVEPAPSGGTQRAPDGGTP